MAKKTAVIDLGSNSIRMVIFEKTSRFAFYISNEYKQKIRLANNCYSDDKELDISSMQKALKALAYLKSMAKKHKCKKILIVGTSALREISNQKEFINFVKSNIALNIKCISGPMEGYLGGIAALNLLANIKDATTIDVGGGSSELCLIKDAKVVKCMSLELGTVRLKELFANKKSKNLQEYVKEIIAKIPDDFKNENIIAIGGSLRAISNSIMKKNSYPFKSIHNYSYHFSQEKRHILKILNSSNQNLSAFSIKKDRFDTIKEGCLIFLELVAKLDGKKIITSGVGVREGVYLNDILNKSKLCKIGIKSASIPQYTPHFPPNFNPSLKSLQDRFSPEKNKVPLLASKIYDALNTEDKLKYKSELLNAAKLVRIGEKLNYYFANEHAFYFAMSSLAFGFSHEEKILIAILLKLNGKKVNDYLIEPYKKMLCGYFMLSTLNFILAVSRVLANNEDYELSFAFERGVLLVYKNSAFQSEALEFKKIARPIFVKKVVLVEL